MPVDREEVLRIAALARLDLDAGEVDAMTAQLNRILEHVEALDAAPTAAATDDDAAAGTPLRPDLPAADPLAFAPDQLTPGWKEGFFTAPRLPSHEP